ncbi:hypothetical protein [Humisphaera borealis]|uniref:Uncharacterized protein n=1 Tax=Humisphaera borealis TaxID=2807512 RepID=A0A7M2X1T5_9BACT|nr:hypothetical protein [Humisphaera borealis]QOV91624.1 hypothetical protein IPV69_09780 [Humisphaera borealis]
MSDLARIDSIDVLRDFRAQVWKFAEAAKVALGDAESELTRTIMWLETEQTAYWAGQIRKRTDLVSRAAEKLREKRVFKDASGRVPSAVDEEKALRVAKAKLEEAEEKAAATKRYIRVLQKTADDYKGAIAGIAAFVAYDIPLSVARLDKLSDILRQYVDLTPAGQGGEGSESVGEGSGSSTTTLMVRSPDSTDSDTQPAEDLPDFPSFEPPQVVLVHTHKPSGLILAADGKSVADEGNQYRRFADLAEAQAYAGRKADSDPLIECAIYNAAKVRL